MVIKNQRKTINGWAFYDWANSVYPLVITSTIFPVYYTAITTHGDSDIVEFFGRHYKNSALYSYSLSASFLLISFISPFLSGIADYTGRKKLFMQIFCYLGSAACMLMYFFDAATLTPGIILFMIASIGYAGSLVFYNAYLPEIATADRQDAVSARGFAFGYIGSSILLLLCLSFFQYPAFYGMENNPALPAKITFLLTGVWWLLFSQVTFLYLPKYDYDREKNGGVIIKGYLELKKVWNEIKKLKTLKRYLLAFLIFDMGIQTVMYVAAIFGAKELKMADNELIITILIIQFVAIAGAFLFSYLSKKFGNIPALGLSLFIWIGVCIAAYFITTSLHFYILGALVGMVMGGSQSLARSTYSKLLPDTTDHASYFSFFDICGKLSVVFGTFIYGYIEELTGNMRYSVVAVMVFFIIGLILLSGVRKKT
ncbi:MAG: MFS transporter [Bacteroidetes bacterium]|nr:MFS transporter [Bacteroidota bacterium]